MSGRFTKKIGILTLQGDFEKHHHLLNKLGYESLSVRYPKQLDQVEGLVIPGGESTTITNLMHEMGFHEALIPFADSFPILGTCAGLIIMATHVLDNRIEPLGLLNITVERNAYGRQVHSFTDRLSVNLGRQKAIIPATFIRAPQIFKIADTVKVLAIYKNKPVAVQEGHHLGLSFHPELDEIALFHDYLFATGVNQVDSKTISRIHAS